MARIGIIGATGMAGSALYKEAIERGHEVTALARNGAKTRQLLGPDASITEKDAFALSREDLAGFDVVVDAFATTPDKAYLHIDLAAKLIALLRETTSPRLVFITGAGSLMTGGDDHLLVEDMQRNPNMGAFISIPESQLKELEFLRGVDNVNWVSVSPGMTFQAGPKKTSLLGKDTLLQNTRGESLTSSGTMAVAILDEIEGPKHSQERFTAIDA